MEMRFFPSDFTQSGDKDTIKEETITEPAEEMENPSTMQKIKLEQISAAIQKTNDEKLGIIEELMRKQMARDDAKSLLQYWINQNSTCRMISGWAVYHLEILRSGLKNELQNRRHLLKQKDVDLCSSSKEDLQNLVTSIRYLLTHNSKNLAAEKQLAKKIRNIQALLDDKKNDEDEDYHFSQNPGNNIEVIQNEVKTILCDSFERTKLEIKGRRMIKRGHKKVEIIEKEISSLKRALESVNKKKGAELEIFCATISELR